MSDSSPPPDLNEAEALELLAALRSVDGAHDDDALDVHERALARAFADADPSAADEPEATPEELAALARGDDLDFMQALRAAHAPRPLAEAAHERALAPLLRPMRRRFGPTPWVASGLALAAAVLLALRLGGDAPQPSARAEDPDTVRSRSTERLVASAAAAGTSTRVDRIAQARSGDYRKNRFRGWGAR